MFQRLAAGIGSLHHIQTQVNDRRSHQLGCPDLNKAPAAIRGKRFFRIFSKVLLLTVHTI
jgi:hypothetical protein